MEFVNYLKASSLLDIVVLAMLEMGYSVAEVASKARISRQTVYDIKKRHESVTEA